MRSIAFAYSGAETRIDAGHVSTQSSMELIVVELSARIPVGLASPLTSSPPVQTPAFPASAPKCFGGMLLTKPDRTSE